MTGRMTKRRWAASAALTVLAGLVAWRVHALVAGAAGPRVPVPHAVRVDAVRAARRSVPLVIEAPGTVTSEHSVAVRAQVGGTLREVRFHEGDEVAAHQLLFVIDPEPYRIAVDQAEGQVEQDKAKLAADQANAARMAKLVKSGYVSTQDDQNAAALVEQDRGLLAADEARLAQAHLNLSYTHITAPIAGRTGALAFKAGNLVQANDAVPLVTINQIAPIEIRFDVPQAQIGSLLAHRNDPALSVAVRGPAGQLVAAGGRLVFIDNAVNSGAGTLAVKAEFANTGRRLWPGELVTAELVLSVQKDALVVPAIAVQPGQNGDYVYTVADGRIAVRDVAVAREHGGLAVISHGLSPGNVVVVHVPRDLREGMPARVRLVAFPSGSSGTAAAADAAT